MRQDLQGSSPFGEWLARTVVDVDPKRRTIEIVYEAREEFANRHGTVAGGMLSAMLDSVTGLVALIALPDELTALHTTLDVEYLRPARVGRLIGRGRVLDQTDRDIRSEGELLDADGNVVARARAALRVLRK
jgi:uncharacterized protein (TIGR00369 family)